MKRSLLFILLLFPCLICSSQTEKKFYLSAFIQPDLVYRIRTYDDFHTDYFKNDNPGFGYSVGVSAGCRFTPVIGMNLALTYSREGYNTSFTPTEYDFNDYFPYPPNIWDYKDFDKIIYVTRASFLNLPLTLNLRYLNHGKLHMGISVGAACKVYLGGNIKSIIIAEGSRDVSNINLKEVTNRKFRSVDLSALLGLDFDYDITERITIQLQPNFECMILPGEVYGDFMRTYLWNAGLKAGVIYNL